VTLCVAITTPDGLVLGADSMTVLRDPESGSTKQYPNAEKVFDLPNLAIAVMTYGLGAIGRSSIGNLIDEWSETRPTFEKGGYTVKDVAQHLGDFIFARHRQVRKEIEREVVRKQDEALSNPAAVRETAEYVPAEWTTGLVMGGYQPDCYFPWLYSWEEPERVGVDPGLVCVRKHEGTLGVDGPVPGIDYWGDTVALDRIYRGLDPSLFAEIASHLPQSANVDVKRLLDRHRWPVLFEMPLQDAIDFAKFMIDLGCNFRRFSPDAPQVGGDADIVVVTRKRIYWPHRKPISTALASVNPIMPRQTYDPSDKTP
jgi:hypothetical protein